MVCQSSLVCGGTFCAKYIPPHMAAHHPANCSQQSTQTSTRKGAVNGNSCEDEKETSADEIRKVPRIKCYVCNERVERNRLKRHLLFGRFKCNDCDTRYKDCKTFSLSRKTCPHRNVDWSKSKPPIDFLEENLRKKYLDVRTELYRYAKKLDDLEQRTPWKGVLSEIKIRKSSEPVRYTEVNVCGRERNISSKKDVNDHRSDRKNSFKKKSIKYEDSRYSQPSSSKQRISNYVKGSSKKKRASMDELFGSDSNPNDEKFNKMTFGKSSFANAAESTVEFLELPADGNYLILQKVIEECPMCYSKLKLKNSVFHVSLLFYKLFCECGLKIFYIPKTPANISHPVTIINTETSPVLMKKTPKKHNPNKRKRGMKIKSTYDLLR